MVLPVPGPPQSRIILLLGNPPVSNLSRPGIPVGVLELAFELPGPSAISLQNGLKRLANHMRSDTSNVSNKIQLPNIQQNASRLRIASGTSEGLGQTGMTSKDRITLYQDQGVQLLLGRFVKGEIVELVPSFDLSQTARYPEVEEVVDGDTTAAKQLVEKLWDVGIFKRKFHEKILVCPSCLSANVSNDYVCPKCNKELIEAGVDYQKLGAWFQCSQCGKRSDLPSPIHRCRSCGHIFTIKDTGFVNIYSYRISADAEEEFKRTFLVMKPIGATLEDFQYKV